MSNEIKLKMCNPSKVKCPFVTLFGKLERPLSAKQDYEAALIKHAKRFKQAQDNVKLIMGTEWFEVFVESTSEHTQETDTDKQKEHNDDSFETFMAHAFL